MIDGKRLLLVAACVLSTAAGIARADYTGHVHVETVINSTTTITGQAITYPSGEAQIRTVVVTVQPGDETGWHQHTVPVVAYILEGEIVVDYGKDGARTYGPGTGFIEALETPHNGRNVSDKPCRILAVFVGAKGTKSTVMLPDVEE